MNLVFEDVKKIFNKNGFRLFMIGGTSRDYLLNKSIKDYDFVTDATPNEMKNFIDFDDTFAKYGTVRYFYNSIKIDITTLRKESCYLDNRHPSKIEFVKEISEDYLRRDFTINSIYIDENYHVIDPSNCGVNDLLNNKVIRFIGDPETRIKEDPIRILRAKRFALEYDLKIPGDINRIFEENSILLKTLNENKVLEEEKKLEVIKREKENGK